MDMAMLGALHQSEPWHGTAPIAQLVPTELWASVHAMWLDACSPQNKTTALEAAVDCGHIRIYERASEVDIRIGSPVQQASSARCGLTQRLFFQKLQSTTKHMPPTRLDRLYM